MSYGKLSFKMLSLTVASLAMSMLVACNKDSGGGSAAPAAAAACGAGYVQSAQYGCLPQGGCPANYGMYQNQCMVLSGGTNSCTVGSVYVGNQCLPQGSCPANHGFNGSTCVVGTSNIATTPQPYPNYNTQYGAYNNGFYNNYVGWQQYYQPQMQYQQPVYYYSQPNYYQQNYYQQPNYYGGGAGVGLYFGLRL